MMASTIDELCRTVVDQRLSITVDDLKSLLDSIYDLLKSNDNLDDHCKIIDAVKKVPVNTLLEETIISHEVFRWIRDLLMNLFNRWRGKNDPLHDKHQYLCRQIVDILSKLISYLKDTDQMSKFSSFQEFFLDQSFFQSLSGLLKDLSENSSNYRSDDDMLKSLNELMGLIQWYQSDNDEIRNDQSMLLLIDPIIKCLSSSTYIEVFKQLNSESSESAPLQEFFLQRCPCYTVWYRGKAQLTIIHQLCVNGILPSYGEIYDLFLPTIELWETPMKESIVYMTSLLRYVALYPTTRIYLKEHTRLIDSILTLLNSNRLVENVLIRADYNAETHLTDSVLSFLFNLTDDLEYLTVLNDHPLFNKDIFFKLTQSKVDRVQLHSFMILSKILDENDIQQLDHVDTLISVFMNYLVNACKDPSHTYEDVPVEDLLVSLKGRLAFLSASVKISLISSKRAIGLFMHSTYLIAVV